MMALSPGMMLLISDAPRERRIEVSTQRLPSIREPWWAVFNRIAWMTASRHVYARRLGDLQATELLVPSQLRRVDPRVLDSRQDAAVMARIRERSEERRRDEIR